MAEQVAWIGLGNMGRLCIQLTKPTSDPGDGQEPRRQISPPNSPNSLNRTQSRARDVASTLARPVTIAPTVTEAVGSSTIIFTCFSDDHAVIETL
ncbi:uncharacterized protein BDCG_17300 [Blastomyces dermatitidis ER-3]|uniref:6-phosphogluconate dehydrogenase NADP-binding domain-containing protein n=2 Tax=Blastomyces TaxID=229219 RepID=A0A179U9J8_BLAGS|nr:uncharacterized protein BDBG_16163 [Blastomyces gilchristii SLH14081]XP_045281670.1 uncharacterized protein BDCG_17300 [Blastomyces dermatitidis ER-3]OAT01943.1 hypothetical protein BDCG_17300 [Blastomyces dermatitidis ER-3]OAT03998.1 hypothetical protein BDBG_16163 [Blastomyces gilchristii SLH14081]